MMILIVILIMPLSLLELRAVRMKKKMITLLTIVKGRN